MKNFNEFLIESEFSKNVDEVMPEIKKNSKEFKKLYGDKWKQVMYAVAAKVAKKHMDIDANSDE